MNRVVGYLAGTLINYPTEEIIEQLKKIFYEIKISEMENVIQQLEKYLSENNISN